MLSCMWPMGGGTTRYSRIVRYIPSREIFYFYKTFPHGFGIAEIFFYIPQDFFISQQYVNIDFAACRCYIES